MSELLKFLVRFSSWFLFFVYLIAGFVLLFSGNPFQHHVYLTSANRVASGLYSTTNSVSSYSVATPILSLRYTVSTM